MRAFIIRPFGTKEGIDFNAVEAKLIDPALRRLGLEGRTTGDIAQAGNIREDMFQLLLTADVVVADITIDNANAFYELGIRHALRAQRTLLLNARAGDVPFDLKTDRYLKYDAGDPGACVEALVTALRETLDSDGVDSPVFKLLGPGIIPQDLSRFLVPPDDFREEVHRAAKERRLGDLMLLSEDAGRLAWAVEGWRVVGNAQFLLESYEPARLTWEGVLAQRPNDVEANERLATIYQRLGNRDLSDEAVERVLASADVRGPERAELQSLRASNMKRRWMDDWSRIDEPGKRREEALRSPWLRKAYDAYAGGFAEDRNHFYSGLNAMALLTILLGLAEERPEAWTAMYDSSEEAALAPRKFQRVKDQLAAAVELSRQSAQRQSQFTGKPDKWLDISGADLAFVTGLPPARVRDLYRTALADAEPFHRDAARKQLQMFRSLNVLADAAAAALAGIQELEPAAAPAADRVAAPGRILLFTGHRIDAADRAAQGKAPRFPTGAEAEARRMIADAVDRERASAGGEMVGIAGGASGGDILFHEVCAERGIKTQLYVAGSREAYVGASVQDGGPAWVERFDRLWRTLPLRVLGNSQGSLDLPRWLRPARDYSVWERNNRWTLANALVYGAQNVTLLALWNGEAGDGPGGSKDMVETAKARGAKVVVLDAAKLIRHAV
jgi:hypothetical protein